MVKEYGWLLRRLCDCVIVWWVRWVRQVLALFSASMQKANITHGFYYSFTNNYYMNVASHIAGHSKTVLKGQVNVSQAEFERIALAQVCNRKHAHICVWFARSGF